SYVQGEVVSFIAGSTNTSSVTLAVSGLATKAITKNGTTALTGGEIVSGAVINVMYDGTQFQLMHPGAIGKFTVDIPGGSFLGTTTAGATASQSESSSNKINRKTIDFVDASTTSAFAVIPLPKS